MPFSDTGGQEKGSKSIVELCFCGTLPVLQHNQIGFFLRVKTGIHTEILSSSSACEERSP